MKTDFGTISTSLYDKNIKMFCSFLRNRNTFPAVGWLSNLCALSASVIAIIVVSDAMPPVLFLLVTTTTNNNNPNNISFNKLIYIILIQVITINV